MKTRVYATVALSALSLSGCDYYHRLFDHGSTTAPARSAAPQAVVEAPVPGASHATSPLAQKKYDNITSGKLVAVSDKELIIETPEDVLFIDIGPNDKPKLANIKKGDPITLRGKVTPAANGKPAQSDVQDILLKDGTDIPL